jgi:hypothetical protein
MVIREQRFSFNQVRRVLGGVLEHDLHAKRVDSLCDATLGVMRSASLAVCMIGQGLAAARGLNPKHATKQVDRLLSNPMINVNDILVRWVPYVGGIECALRDTKDLRFGMGMGTVHVNSPERRDRLWLINAFAVVLLTLLGAAGEALGYDRMLKTNTAKRRVHSLFRQGCILYDLIPMMPEARLRPLMQRFSRMLHEQPLFANVFGPV